MVRKDFHFKTPGEKVSQPAGRNIPERLKWQEQLLWALCRNEADEKNGSWKDRRLHRSLQTLARASSLTKTKEEPPTKGSLSTSGVLCLTVTRIFGTL